MTNPCWRPKAAFPNHKDRVEMTLKGKGNICICMTCETQVYGAEITFDELSALTDEIKKRRKYKERLN